ncbi:hypothetical protein LEP1GSC029_1993 [Leptospira interrogans str. 2002000626]|uniref:Uncharacterized protein n=1 Tax=Leptospira interrogans str. 2002000626 TaxID=996803 RepID=A0A829D1W4_LEPIR|nr:hypothetical protein LEP1GSC029_1993 [Leptospira interrogans str. 2002000626]
MTKSVGTTAFDYKFLKNDCVKNFWGFGTNSDRVGIRIFKSRFV